MTSLHSNTDDAPRKSDTFLLPSPSPADKRHLHVAVTDPFDSGNHIPRILLVSVASIRPNGFSYDQTCILKPNDHPFIKHDSYVVYRHAKIMELRELEKMLANGSITPKERASVEVVVRIIAGIENSSAIKNYIIEFLRQARG